VRYSIAVNNVAGIEIENSIDAEVYENHTYDNTGGILIFDLPDLVQKKGGHIRIYNNLIEHNNLFNFAPEGAIVGKVIPGTGVMVLAASDVHVYDNTIRNNKSVGTAIVSYFITEEAINDSLYNPYTSSIHIYNNEYERSPGLPALDYEIGQLLAIKYGRNTPDIIYDGMPDPAYINADGVILPESNLCIQNNSNARFTNMDIENNFEKWYSPFLSDFSEDLTPFHCGITHHPVATSK
jgi:parallel beta-helix repeat protein